MAGSVFNQGGMSLPPSPFSSKQRAYKRKAYGSVRWVGNKQFTCGKDFPLTFGGDTNTKYTQGGALQPRSGGRYAPNAHLTSITTKNQGSGGIEDTALWEIEFQYTCYTEAQLDQCSNAFMIPGNLIDVTIGYDPGDELKIKKANVYDFSFSYNSDNGTYSCTCKCLGSNSNSLLAGALKIGPNKKSEETDEGGKTNTGYGLIENLRIQCDNVLKLKRDKEGNLKSDNVPVADGVAKSKDGFGLIKGQKAASTLDMLLSLGGADNILVPCVQIKKVIDFINEVINVSGGLYVLKDDEFECRYDATGLSELKSADPMTFCLPGERGNYGERNNFKDLTGEPGVVGDVYVSITKLLDIESKVFESAKKSGNDFSTNQFLTSMFNELSSCTGTAIDCFLSENDEKFYIVNRKHDIKKQSKGTVIKLLDPNSPVKSLSMSSNMDSDMAAIAFAGGSGKFADGVVKNVFAGCDPKTTSESSDVETPTESVKKKMAEIGEDYDANIVSDTKSVLKKYVNRNVKNISMRFNIDLNVTFDGWDGPKFMERFSVSPLPNVVSGGDVYFAVGEIEHKCDGDTWETGVTGYMMVNS